MCGINGFNFNNQDLINKMNERVIHRGPDQKGIYLDEYVSLGQTRLSIIDLSAKGKPPIFNEDKSMVIVANGELYNYQSIRKDLIDKGHKFYSKTDTEVIIHAYEQYGVECLKIFNGIYTFAIWDKNKKNLFIARDRVGIKPLYYYFENKKFIFSSEIKAILSLAVKRQVNIDALNHFFRLGYVPQPLTMFQGIYKLPSASYLILKQGKLTIKKYWQISDFQNINSELEIREQIKNLINDAVKLQLVSDRPVGLYLSGGIDSTVLAGLVTKHYSKKLATFSVGFDRGVEKFNADLRLAKKVSQYYSTDHQELIITGKDIFNSIEKIIYHLDEPIANTSQVAELFLAQEAKKKVAVILTGGGGDELFGGYPRYYFSHLIDRYQSFPKIVRNNFVIGLAEKIFKKDLKNKFNSRGFERYRQFMVRKEKEILGILKQEINKPEIVTNFFTDHFFQNYPKKDFTKYFMLVDMLTWLIDFGLIENDKLSMSNGLEQRLPLLDHRLIELSMKIPTKLKIKGKKNKWIFKKAMSDYLPDFIINEPKRGFFAPFSEWLRRELKPLADEVLSPNYCSETAQYFNFQAIDQIYHDHLSKKGYHLNVLMSLLIWQIWYKLYIKQ